jgi:hypothetical protein
MFEIHQPTVFSLPEIALHVEAFIRSILTSYRRPSAHELLAELEQEIGLESRWDLSNILEWLADDEEITGADRDYIRSLLEDGSLSEALRGDSAPAREVASTIDALLHQSKLYRSSIAFREMVEFMGRFRDYAPYNNMLVRLQNPGCNFYATAKDWQVRFGRKIKEDARPMLILAPMHPVMLVYDLDQTIGPPLPAELLNFSRFEGEWRDEWLNRFVKNANGHRIRVDFKSLSSTHSGFATIDRGSDDWKMRIAIHDGLDNPSRLGVSVEQQLKRQRRLTPGMDTCAIGLCLRYSRLLQKIRQLTLSIKSFARSMNHGLMFLRAISKLLSPNAMVISAMLLLVLKPRRIHVSSLLTGCDSTLARCYKKNLKRAACSLA